MTHFTLRKIRLRLAFHVKNSTNETSADAAFSCGCGYECDVGHWKWGAYGGINLCTEEDTHVFMLGFMRYLRHIALK